MTAPAHLHDPLPRRVLMMQAHRIFEELKSVRHENVVSVGSGLSAVEYCLIAKKGFLSLPRPAVAQAYNMPYHFCVQADMNLLPVKDKSVDCLLLLNAYHHLPVASRADFDEEITRIVRHGGRVIMVEPISKPWRKFGRLLAPGKWDQVHDPDESELTNQDLNRLKENRYFHRLRVEPFTFIYQPLLYVSLARWIQYLTGLLEPLDYLLRFLGIGWTYYIIFDLNRTNSS